MNNNKIMKFTILTLLLLTLTLALMNTAWAQTSQQPLTITIKDEVTGGIAEGVTVIIEDANGTTILTAQTTPGEPIQTSLPNGNYTILVQTSLFGVPTTLGTKSFDLTKPTDIEIKLSAAFIPIKYVAWTVYGVTTAATTAAVLISLFELRHLLELRKVHTLVKAATAAKAALIAAGGAVAVSVGASITVLPDPKVLLTFSQVTRAGAATATPLTSFPPLPKGALFLGAVWDIKTTAAFTGMTVVGIYFGGLGLTDKQKKKLKVYRTDFGNKSTWKGLTSSIDTENNIAYGATDHFSGFGVH
jgi:hypothetical protein